MAQPSPNGAELQINALTTDNQAWVDIVSLPNQGFVAVWYSNASGGTDTEESIQGRRFGPHGSPLSSDFQVNSVTTGSQSRPAIAGDASGGFVAVWGSGGSAGTDTDSTSVQVRRFSSDGTPLADDLQVNTYTTGNQHLPDVASSPGGDFVVVWQSDGSPESDSSFYSIQARRFASNGIPAGPQFQVNTYTTSYQLYPATAMDDDGRFVVVWSSLGSTGTDTSTFSVQARRFAADGAPLGDEFQVNSDTIGAQLDAVVVFEDGGGFVVAWHSDSSPGDPSGAIRGQRFDENGAPIGGEFQVNAYTTGTQSEPAIARDPSGGFLVAWDSAGSIGNDLSGRSIQARRFDSDASPIGPEFQVNTYTTANQWYPSIHADPLGNFVVVWASNGSAGSDDSGGSVHAQLYDALFRDGFEDGSTSRWSAD